MFVQKNSSEEIKIRKQTDGGITMYAMKAIKFQLCVKTM